MEVISLSLDEETLEKIDEIQDEASFSGRSELIRKAIENLHQETISNQRLRGELNAVVVVRHPHSEEQKIGEIAHKFDSVITTQLHSKLSGDKCLEVFHTHGDADTVIEFYDALKGSRHTDSADILPQNS